MASFRDKNVDKNFRTGGALANACLEDVTLAIRLLRKRRQEILAAEEASLDDSNITLDPLPAKQSTPRNAGEDQED